MHARYDVKTHLWIGGGGKMASTPQHHTDKQEQKSAKLWILPLQEGSSKCYFDPEGRFAIVAAGDVDPHQFLKLDAYSAAKAFVNGTFSVRGDIFAAIRCFFDQPHHRLREFLFSIAATAERFRSYIASRRRTLRDIQFHYDRSNEFYRQFLDSRLVYSAAWFENPSVSLEEAQRAKLDRICRDLQLRRGDRFLDIGCGWGGLVMHAAEHFGVAAFGYTLAKEQFEYARHTVLHRGLTGQVTIQLCDYRDLEGRFDKIASVGMFEHVGRKRLRSYFAKVYSLLEPGGRFLNRGIVRPEGVSDGPDTLFIQKYVFPGGSLVYLDDVVREGESAGFEVIGMEDLRLHYALTCRAWVQNLEQNSETCKTLVGERTYRIWLIYLAASAVGFEQGRISCAQVLFAKP
jgi:cyclopropane-fatty-acyl-phospholipid synthase